jgi:hypothetical protein
MKTLRITAALLLALTAAACTGSPTAPTLELSGAGAQANGTGFFGGGTRAP